MARRQQLQLERRRSRRGTVPSLPVVVPTRPVASTRAAADLLQRIDRVLGAR